jgi:hypothetical protein
LMPVSLLDRPTMSSALGSAQKTLQRHLGPVREAGSQIAIRTKV